MKKYDFDSLGVAGCLVIIGVILAAILITIGVIALEGLAVMLLWNWLVPLIFVGAPTISYWMALGIMFLCHLLFGAVKVVTTRRD